jgi:hypothetical protein
MLFAAVKKNRLRSSNLDKKIPIRRKKTPDGGTAAVPGTGAVP